MGSKNNPGEFDCYAAALPDEPMFILLARDTAFSAIVTEWARFRRHEIVTGERPATDMAMVEEATDCAAAGRRWRRENLGKWKRKS